MTNNNKNDTDKHHILKFLSDTANLYNSYHNHKELSAWGALVFYIALSMGFISEINKN